MQNTEYAYAGEIVKYDKTPEGLMVYGKAAGPDLDLDGQICDPSWLKQAMPDWMRFGNIRAQHSAVAAGVGKELSATGDDWNLKSLIVDEDSIRKVEAGVYKGYSVGIKGAKIVKDQTAPGGRVVGGHVVEVSLVDRPCNPTALMGIAKAVGSDLTPVDQAGVSLFKVADTADEAEVTKDAGTGCGCCDDCTMTEKAATPEPTEPSEAMELLKSLTADLVKYDEVDDIDGATHVMSLIGALIESEAGGLAGGRDEEAYDIRILLDALGVMSQFRDRERMQDDGPDDGDDGDDVGADSADDLNGSITYAALAADGDTEPVAAEVEKRDFSQKERDAAADSGAAMPDGSFPIHNTSDLSNAIHLAGNAKDPAAARRHIKQRARDLGASDMIPDSWNEGSKSATVDNGQPEDLMKWATADNIKTLGLVTADEVKTALDERDNLIKTLTEQAEADREVIAAQEETLKALRADVAKVLASPVPGGPVIMRRSDAQTGKPQSEAARLRALAERTDDPYLRLGYIQRADSAKD